MHHIVKVETCFESYLYVGVSNRAITTCTHWALHSPKWILDTNRKNERTRRPCKMLLLLLLFFVLCNPNVAFGGSSNSLYPEGKSSVLELNVGNYKSTLASLRSTYPAVIVEYYSSWCGHCQHFAPKYEAVSHPYRALILSLLLNHSLCTSFTVCPESKATRVESQDCCSQLRY